MLSMLDYQAPWYLTSGWLQTFLVDFWYGVTWRHLKDEAFWLNHLPKIPWQEHIFTGADNVPLWGIWSCPPQARGTIILNLGITGQVHKAWYAHIFARKAHQRGFAVLMYDWRGHGKTAELSPVPQSYGWREGSDQVQLAAQLVALGCPKNVTLAGFSLGGQLALWGLHAAAAAQCSYIRGAAVLSPNLESTRSLAHLQSTFAGRQIEQIFVRNLRAEVQKRQRLFPNTLKPGNLERIHSIDSFDHEIVIDYYGFASVAEYYRKTSGLYILEKLDRPYLMIYAQDDPMYEPAIIAELQQRIRTNPKASLMLTKRGGHLAHIAPRTVDEDRFWAMNRMLEFCDRL